NRKPYHKAKTRQIPLKSLYRRFKPYRCLSLYATTLPITAGEPTHIRIVHSPQYRYDCFGRGLDDLSALLTDTRLFRINC
ncbi:hypothetical protein, partial [Leuconostoc mesenteroides]|uniref:hypothetical protein n=1 Tax=Leuconostoc mesenteroides TaxID=1245 RepID=UPI00235EA5C0